MEIWSQPRERTSMASRRNHIKQRYMFFPCWENPEHIQDGGLTGKDLLGPPAPDSSSAA
jgi:hypothetical protein